jgi:type VI protein secretion system component VasK
MGEKVEATKWLFWAVFAIIILTLTSWALWPVSKAVERVVLEQSFQYSEGKKAEIAILRSTLEEIDAKLGTSLDQQSKQNLEAQRMTVSVQLKAAERR